ncbi:cation:proton antiporter [Nocardia ninae]|uniref:Cation transporter n=1 Tax=Nocardia ninae NBRC 108245 TaxID=1210091 RepID=A0A511MS80_9NOCA|nr:cation:proton antiporter [Nocardia ninae]GEM43047.1 cation transporter [Nocardia ninae NBRC 108245]
MTNLDIERAYLIAGIALLLAATLPRLFKDRAITAPMLMLGVGAVGGLVIGPTGLRAVSPLSHPTVIEHLAEVCVIVALMGVGLAIDRPLHWRTWGSTWRLLMITMPLCIAAVAVFGWWAAALSPAAAVLLAAVLAPTDPVLASDVQVEGPTPGGAGSAEEDDEVRFALTSEAGLNDALAFPFVYLAIFLATQGSVQNWFAGWFAWELLGKIAVGALLGAIVGDLLGRGLFRFPIENARLADQGEPIAALAAVFAVYGLTELVGGYGFLAVFACAIAMRRIERDSGYHEQMHSLVEQLEHVLTLVVLLLLGAALTTGLLNALSWQGAAVGVLLVFVFRPFAGWLALQRCDEMAPKERAVTAFFGVRGIGSVYYVSYGLTQAALSSEAETLWAITAFTIVLSVLVHGASAGWVMKHLENVRGKESA